MLRWNLYRGGIDKANEQEKISRASEQGWFSTRSIARSRKRCASPGTAASGSAELAKLAASGSRQRTQMVSSYREQFKVGQRSLLDVLDAQNTRFNTTILADTAQLRVAFRRIPASCGDRRIGGTAGPFRPRSSRTPMHARSSMCRRRAGGGDLCADAVAPGKQSALRSCWRRSGRRSSQCHDDRHERVRLVNHHRESPPRQKRFQELLSGIAAYPRPAERRDGIVFRVIPIDPNAITRRNRAIADRIGIEARV